MILIRSVEEALHDRCHSRNSRGRGHWSKQTTDPDNKYATAGAMYYPAMLQQPALQPHSEPDGLLLLRNDNQTAEDLRTQQCSADANHCEKKTVPTMYAYSENDTSVYILDSLSLDRYVAYQNEVKDPENNKTQIAIMEAYGARRVKKASKDPGLDAIHKKAKVHEDSVR